MSGKRSRRMTFVLTAVAALLGAAPVWSDDDGIRGRFSLFAGWADREHGDGTSSDLSDVVVTLSLAPEGDESRWDYRLDLRGAAYPGSDARDERLSIYEAWIGRHAANGRWRLRIGQVWARELGALGRAWGFAAEMPLGEAGRLGRLRIGAVAGLEPEILDTDYRDGVWKSGLFVATDGAGGRRHVLGWVQLRNHELTERSVVVLSNFIPVRRSFFLFQMLEYDLRGPAGLGDGGLSYLFTSARFGPSRRVTVQATYHRGRSIDTRGITQDVLDGRAVDPERLDGLLFESARIRLTVSPKRGLRLWAGVGGDRHNRSDEWSDRLSYGVFCNDLAGTGLDLSAARDQIERSDRSYHSDRFSIGRSLGPRVYASIDYVSSLSIFIFAAGDGGTVEVRPESDRWALSVNTSLSRRLSVLLSGEWMEVDSREELRLLAGLTVRF